MLAQHGIVFANAAGKDQHIEATDAGAECPNSRTTRCENSSAANSAASELQARKVRRSVLSPDTPDTPDTPRKPRTAPLLWA
ncbi:hypothetical protein [Limnohabitans sp.]|uniref:hypothetical protein n=1 Tax=Limnohabitans sp. TaxID=1907725 RepID=UPI0037C07808